MSWLFPHDQLGLIVCFAPFHTRVIFVVWHVSAIQHLAQNNSPCVEKWTLILWGFCCYFRMSFKFKITMKCFIRCTEQTLQCKGWREGDVHRRCRPIGCHCFFRVKTDHRTGDQQLSRYQITWWTEAFNFKPGQDNR